MLKLSTVQHESSEQKFLGDNFVIQSWIHTNQRIDFAAAKGMRLAGSLSTGLCVNFDKPNYPELGGSVRLETRN